jgi:uncharacterized membrane protein
MKGERSIAGRLFGLFVYGLGAVMAAGVVHIVSVLAMPRLASQDAFTRVAALAPMGKMTLLAPITPKTSPFDFEDAATALGVCRYDLAQGPLQIFADLEPEQMMLFSFHARFGDVFYSMSDRVASHGRFDVLVLTPDQLDAYEAADTGDELPKELRIVSPSLQGFVLVRAFAEQRGDLPVARAAIAAMHCGTTQAPQT